MYFTRNVYQTQVATFENSQNVEDANKDDRAVGCCASLLLIYPYKEDRNP